MVADYFTVESWNLKREHVLFFMEPGDRHGRRLMRPMAAQQSVPVDGFGIREQLCTRHDRQPYQHPASASRRLILAELAPLIAGPLLPPHVGNSRRGADLRVPDETCQELP